MNVELRVIKNNQTWDLSNTVGEITLSTSMYDQPGTAEFTLYDSNSYPNGSIVTIKVDGIGMFQGYIFENTVNAKGETSIKAYDQMRYLRNQDTIYTEDKTASQIFEDIATRYQLTYKVVNPSSYIALPYLHDKQTMFSILQKSLDETLINEGKTYYIRDNFGTMEFIQVEEQKTGLVVGTGSVMTDFQFTQSIDKDTYNYVKLLRDNNETVQRDYWVSEDTDTIAKWGLLQFTQDVDEKANEQQIKELGKNILAAKNRETMELSLSVVGFYPLRAGDGIRVEIQSPSENQTGINNETFGVISQWFYLKSVTTTIYNSYATMGLEVFIPNGGE